MSEFDSFPFKTSDFQVEKWDTDKKGWFMVNTSNRLDTAQEILDINARNGGRHRIVQVIASKVTEIYRIKWLVDGEWKTGRDFWTDLARAKSVAAQYFITGRDVRVIDVDGNDVATLTHN